MLLKIFLSVSTIILTSRISCDAIFGVENSVLELALKRILPFDVSPAFAFMRTASHVTSKVGKLRNLTGNPVSGLVAETGTLLKETIFSTKDLDEKEVSFYNILPKIGNITVEEMSKTKGKLFFIVHGWVEDATDADWTKKMAKSLVDNFKKSKVVVVDWGSSSNKYLYPLAASLTKGVGKLISKKLVELVETYKFPLEKIILIGYDLGAHVCGHAGQAFAKATLKKLPEIIGLDPSGPLFEGQNHKNRLDETDADIVMVVHTGSSLLGYVDKCGTIDFYPNGGYSQPGCTNGNLLCNHQRSFSLFTSAISKPKKFPTKKCNSSKEYEEDKCKDSDVLFGRIFEKSKGQYYFNTTDKAPFYQTLASKLNPLNWG